MYVTLVFFASIVVTCDYIIFWQLYFYVFVQIGLAPFRQLMEALSVSCQEKGPKCLFCC